MGDIIDYFEEEWGECVKVGFVIERGEAIWTWGFSLRGGFNSFPEFCFSYRGVNGPGSVMVKSGEVRVSKVFCYGRCGIIMCSICVADII